MHCVEITESQCGHFTIFLPLRFYVKSKSGVTKTAILTILEALNVDFLGKISHFKVSKIPKIAKFRASKMVKTAVFGVTN